MDRLRGADGRDLLLFVLGPALAVWLLVLGIGLVLAGPLAPLLQAEDAVNQGLALQRTAAWDTISFFWSYLGSTEVIVGVCLLVCGVVLWRTRDWRLAAVPAIAVLLQLIIYLGITAVVRRERPSVDRLDVLLPFSSFPSGHVGASTALYLTFILLALHSTRVRMRPVVITICVLVPLLVAFARFYRGMHHLSDIAAGAAVGVACALLAFGWYQQRARDPRARGVTARGPAGGMPPD